MSGASAAVGVADHAGWAVLVTATVDGRLHDRRRIELLDPGLPALVYHHAAQGLPLDDAIALVAAVHASARRHAADRLAALAAAVEVPIDAIALRAAPSLPATVAERLADYRAQNVADTVLIREALAEAAAARGWRVVDYTRRAVFEAATRALGAPVEAHLARVGAAIGPPWRIDHRVAMAAAIAAG